MGYNVSAKTINAYKDQLDVLLNNDSNEIVFESNSVNALHYKLNEALASAERLGHDKYKDLRSTYKLTIENGYVIARRRLDKESITTFVTIDSIEDIDFDIQDAIIKNRESRVRLKFPTVTEIPDLIKIYVEKYGYKWGIDNEKGLWIQL